MKQHKRQQILKVLQLIIFMYITSLVVYGILSSSIKMIFIMSLNLTIPFIFYRMTLYKNNSVTIQKIDLYLFKLSYETPQVFRFTYNSYNLFDVFISIISGVITAILLYINQYTNSLWLYVNTALVTLVMASYYHIKYYKHYRNDYTSNVDTTENKDDKEYKINATLPNIYVNGIEVLNNRVNIALTMLFYVVAYKYKAKLKNHEIVLNTSDHYYLRDTRDHELNISVILNNLPFIINGENMIIEPSNVYNIKEGTLYFNSRAEVTYMLNRICHYVEHNSELFKGIMCDKGTTLWKKN